jgi:CRISPR-associated protein Csb2
MEGNGMYFVVRVRFLGGYQAREWPPSPARLFKALVAVSRQGAPGASRDEVDAALRCLERRTAPDVLAAQAQPMRSRLLRFVPNNSTVDPKTGKPEWPANRVSKEPEPVRAWQIDPLAEVVYVWPGVTGGRETDVLGAVARRVPSLGKGEDFVAVQSECVDAYPNTEGLICYRPSGRGGEVSLEVPESGCLAVCLEMFKRRAADPGWNRIHELPTMGTHLEHYDRHGGLPAKPRPPVAIFGLWRGTRRRAFDSRLFRVPVGQCRHLIPIALNEAVAEIARDPGERAELQRLGEGVICGHSATGGKYEGPHIAVAPLPSVLGPYPDGRVRRLALVGFGCTEEATKRLFEAVVALLHGREFLDGGQGTGVVLRKEEGSEWLSLLMGPATEWESVTPVVLDRPEFLRKEWERLQRERRAVLATDPDVDTKTAAAIETSLVSRREELVRAAIERFGAGDVLRVEVARAPWRAGLHPASQYRATDYLRASPRFHIRVSFREPVRGPIVVGRGRYVGFGVLRPTP